MHTQHLKKPPRKLAVFWMRPSGERYRQEILEVGGSRSAAESFKAFRGREPEIDALLRHGGLA